MLRRTARRAIRTFLIPPTRDEAGDLTGRLVYAVWITPTRGPAHDARHSLSLPTQRPRGVAVVRVWPRVGPDAAAAPGPTRGPIIGPDPTELRRPPATTDVGAR